MENSPNVQTCHISDEINVTAASFFLIANRFPKVGVSGHPDFRLLMEGQLRRRLAEGHSFRP